MTMCKATVENGGSTEMAKCGQGGSRVGPIEQHQARKDDEVEDENVPIKTVMAPPSAMARYTCASMVVAVFAVWGKFAFVQQENVPGNNDAELHNWKVPMSMTVAYLVALPVLRIFAKHFLSSAVDVKALLFESMVFYNAGQVILNGWMVYKFIDALLFRGHPFIGASCDLVSTGASYAVYVHYIDKYLEFMDTIFMVLRGKMDQVSFLHVYHHTSIAWAWWFGIYFHPGGDIYFGALLNSLIHVMMYSYYTLSLLKISCPWKKYLTQAQLLQFMSVMVYTSTMMYKMSSQKSGTWNEYAACAIQQFEMISLFALFMHFYFKAYSKKKSAALKAAAKSTSSLASTDSDSGADVVTEQDSVSSTSSDDRSS